MPLTAKGHEIEANMKKEYGEKHGEEVFYASRNKGTISGVDSVPLGACYASKDDVPRELLHSFPAISPTSTSQYSGMQEQARTAPQPEPHEPIDAASNHPEHVSGMLAGGKKTVSQVNHALREKFGRSGDLGKQELEAMGFKVHSEVGRHGRMEHWVSKDSEMSSADTFARLGAMTPGGDAWGDMAARRDFASDVGSPMGGLPQEITHRQMTEMGAGFNYNQGLHGSPYKK